jgi:zinc protease
MWLIAVMYAAAVPGLASEPLGRDPNNVYGKFDNGLTYIVRHNERPPQRVAFYLHVKSGALDETDSQNGLAHFLEHMAFNGSKSFAPGELIPYMNKLGMQFGAHSNAHTNFDETVYKLFMPDTSDKSIDTALTIFSDWSSGLLLLPEEIDKERGIILEESRRGKGPQQRIFDQFRQQVFAGSRLAVHDVIGDEAQIEKFPKAEFDDYWNTWYRPDNMTLIVVGDIDPQAIVAKAREKLGSFKARNDGRPAPGAGLQPVSQVRAFIFTDPEQVPGQVQLMVINPPRPPMTTYDDYRYNELENLGTWMVNRRLAEMVDRGEAAFRRGGAEVSNFLNEATMPEVSAFGEPEDWNRMFEQLVIETSRAIEHGFTPHELELARKEWIAGAERAVEVEGTRDNQAWVGSISRAIGMEEPILSASQRLELVKRVVRDVTPEEIHSVFVKNFKTPNYNYILTLPDKKEGLKLPTSQDVLAAASAAWARKTEAPVEHKPVENILAELPAPGRVVSQATDADLGITTATLSNGVVVHHRFMDYKKDEVLVSILLAGGRIQETQANKGVSEVAALANATSRLTSTQIRDVMTGKKVNFDGRAGLDVMSLSISGSPADLETGFQLTHAMLTDGRIEQPALDKWKEGRRQALEMRKTQPQGQLDIAREEAFFAGDVRLRQLTAEEIDRQTVAAGEQWLRQLSGSAPIEVAVVGEISLDRTMELVCRYLGSLAQRSLGSDLDALRTLKRGPGPYDKLIRFESLTPRAQVVAGVVGAEEKEIRDVRLLTLASMVISDRMIKRLREDEQLVYSVRASHQPGRAIPGLGLLGSESSTDPDKAERLADTILEMFKEFAAGGPTDEEMGIVRKQIANVLETQMKEPRFWLGQISDLNYRGKSLEDVKALPGVYQTFKADELKDVVARYMKDDRLVRLLAIPNGQAKTTTEPSSEKAAQPAGSRMP